MRNVHMIQTQKIQKTIFFYFFFYFLNQTFFLNIDECIINIKKNVSMLCEYLAMCFFWNKNKRKKDIKNWLIIYFERGNSQSVIFPQCTTQRCCLLPCDASPDLNLLKYDLSNRNKLANYVQLNLKYFPDILYIFIERYACPKKTIS